MLEDKEMNLTIGSNENSTPQQLYTQTSNRPQSEVEEDKLLELLKAMSAETAQLSEYLTREKELISDLCEILHEILTNLRISFDIPIDRVAKFNSATKIKLDKKANLIIFWSNSKVDSKPLKEYAPDVILEVFWTILPELGKVVRMSMEGIKRRVNLLVKIREQMKTFGETLRGPSKESYILVQDENTENPLLENDQKSIS